MRQDDATGGYTCGDPHGASLDIIPVVGGLSADGLLRAIQAAITDGSMTWERLAGGKGMAAEYPPGWRGLVGRSMSVIVLLIYPPPLGVTQALQAIEQYEPDPDPLPASLCLAFMIADRALKYSLPPEQLIGSAALAAQVANVIQPGSGASRSRREIEAMAIHHIDSPDAGGEALVSLAGSDQARYLLEIGSLAWKPGWMVKVHALSARHRLVDHMEAMAAGDLDRINTREMIEFGNLHILTTFAVVDLALRPEPAIEIAGVHLRGNLTDITNLYVQACELAAGGISADAVRTLYPDGILRVGAKIEPDPPDSLDLLHGLANSLLREAQQQQAYIPFGAFSVDLPADLAIARAGVSSLRVFAGAQELWVRLVNPNGGAVVRWRPDHRGGSIMLLPAVAAWLDVTLAALWHDLVVAGEIAVPERSRAKAQGPVRPAGDRRASSVRSLPGPRRLRLSGKREWGSREEREKISRRAHGVRGHLRKLPAGWQTSGRARETGVEFGVILPDGFTFVQPHLRGGRVDEPGAAAPAPEPTRIRARGLASLITLLS
jgi:hypothetical protein